MQFRIRPISVEDAEAIAQLSAQLGYSLSVEETTLNIKGVLTSADACAFVAVAHEDVVGWIHAFKTFRLESRCFVEIGGLVVRENYRHEGIAKALIERVKQWCIEKETFTLRLRTNILRTAAHLFYGRPGFIEIKKQKVYETRVLPT